MPAIQLRPFQKTGSAFLANRRSALLADQMGLGKTVQAIDASIRVMARRVLVICPASIKFVWQNHWKQMCPSDKVVVISGTRACIPTDYTVLVINYDLIVRHWIYSQLIKHKFSVGIFDESHYLKNGQSQRTKAVLLKNGLGSRCYRMWFLTGTPVTNRPVELYPILKAAAAETLGPYRTKASFAERFCGRFWDGTKYDDTGSSNEDDLNKRLHRFMLRRTKEQVLKDLPQKEYQLITLVPKSGKIKEMVQSEFNWRYGDLKRGIEQIRSADEMRQQIALAKLPDCVNHINNVMQNVDKLVVFAYHRSVLNGLYESLKDYCPVMIHGGIPQASREQLVNGFQKAKSIQIFIGQIQAAGVGLTLTAASTAVFVEISYVPGEIEQAVDRLHRIGQRDSVLAQFMMMQGSVEEDVICSVITKRRTIKKIVETTQPLSQETM